MIKITPTLLATILLTTLPSGAGATDPQLQQTLQTAINDTTQFHDRYQSEVWYKDMSHRLRDKIKDVKKRLALLKLIRNEAVRAGLQPELVLAVIEVESGFDAYAISKTGALGLMQVMPFWLKQIGHPNDNLFDIRTNLRMGCTILSYYLKKENGDLAKALARYNGSRRKSKYPDQVLTALSERWFRG